MRYKMVIERTYNVPLRNGFINTAKYKKTKKATATLKEFLAKHMKSQNVLIGKNLNKALWQHGIKNPPHHIKVTVIKEDDGTVKAELIGFKFEHKKKEQKEKEQKEESKEEKSADKKVVEKNSEPKEDTPKK